ncbi:MULTISPECIES: 5'-methylthioadenosine/S-adenosylhomocysteine nucleosidase [unclassified Lentilitoribacter]|uniref:phosphorylase family protein n=1 Tax=unclassified Lentilitoribacter TaxID=2647570 RepID=UPI0013A68A0A|nr:5'-methylthioadenosine/S-adenosylhomocysteine nucleosidase [Lentilitoribacter sp. Alg239-R112]
MSNETFKRMAGKSPLSFAIIIPTIKEFDVIVPTIKGALAEFILINASRPSGRVPAKEEKRDNQTLTSQIIEVAIGEHFHKVGFFCSTQMGNAFSAAITGYVISEYSPSMIISAGIAGGLNPLKTKLGDVIIPFEVRYLGYDKVGDYLNYEKEKKHTQALEKITMFQENDFYMRFKQKSANFFDTDGSAYLALKDYLSELKLESTELQESVTNSLNKNEIEYSDHDCKIFRGDKTAIFSWEKVLDSRKFAEGISGKNATLFDDCPAVDMESYGFLQTINILPKGKRPDALIVRGISDYVGLKHVTDNLDYKWRNHAMRNVGYTISEIIRKRSK